MEKIKSIRNAFHLSFMISPISFQQNYKGGFFILKLKVNSTKIKSRNKIN